MINYKGLFYKEDSKKPNYEGGAHFKYKDLVRALEDLKIKKDEEENDKQYHSRNKPQDFFQEDFQLELLFLLYELHELMKYYFHYNYNHYKNHYCSQH